MIANASPIVGTTALQTMPGASQASSNSAATSGTSGPGTVPTASSTPEVSNHQTSSKDGGSSDPSTLVKHVDNLKKQIADSQYTVEFDTAPNAQRGWLNVVDKSTGKVVYEIPSEQVRKWVEDSNGRVSGLSINSAR